MTGVDTFAEQAGSMLPAVLVPLVGPTWAAQLTLVTGGLVLAAVSLAGAVLAERSRSLQAGIN